jgi:hypothetical protein
MQTLTTLSLINLYLTSAMALDPAWYAEHAGFGGAQQDVAMHKAVSAALPFLDEWLVRTGAEAYSQVPILSDINISLMA